MTKSKKYMILIALALASGGLAALVSFSLQSILIILGVTFAVSFIITVALPIRHDMITVVVGLSSAITFITKEIGPFSPIVLVIFVAVPYIGAAIGRDIRGF